MSLSEEPEAILAAAAELLRTDRAAEAAARLEPFCELQPQSARAWFLTGLARQRLRRPEAALAALERALELDARLTDAFELKAALLSELARPAEALAVLQRLAALVAENPKLLADTAIALESLGRHDEALAGYERALRLDPACFPALLNRGALLARLGRLGEALANNQQFVRRYVGSADAHYNLADVLLMLGRDAEALACTESALRLAPRKAEIHMLRGLALSMLRRFAEARAAFAAAEAIDPAAVRRFRLRAAQAVGAGAGELGDDPREIYLARILERQKLCDWSGRPQLLAQLRELLAELAVAVRPVKEKAIAFNAMALPLVPAEQRLLAEAVHAGVAAAAGGGSVLQGSSGAPARRLRIGYLSPDFREHPTAYNLWRLLELHDRQAFEVHGYSLRGDDGSGVRRRIEMHCDVFLELSGLSDEEAAQRISRDGIDILVDRTGYQDYSRPGIPARRPAPLIVSYMGMPATLGGLAGYRITDIVTTPPGEDDHWNEALIRLPDTLWMYDNPPLDAAPAREECGLPRQGFVFCCFNNSFKIEPDVFDVWMRLLRETEGGVLWLIDGGEALRRNLRREAQARGVAPERLVFAPRLPRAQHLARHACADLFLDTFYCNAHTTAVDALWAGLPVLTCAGTTMAARLGASVVRAAGLEELVAATREEYAARALELARQPQALAALGARLRSGRDACALFDLKRRAREIETAYRIIWQRHRDGLPPAPFPVARPD